MFLKAEIETGINYFFCKENREILDKSEGGCGRMCLDYMPRNGIKGICKHHRFCYSEGKAHILTIDGKLKEKS